MYKRIEKRRKRQQDEEELGLDENMKDVLGLNNTDSDESSSSQSSEEDQPQPTKKKREFKESRSREPSHMWGYDSNFNSNDLSSSHSSQDELAKQKLLEPSHMWGYDEDQGDSQSSLLDEGEATLLEEPLIEDGQTNEDGGEGELANDQIAFESVMQVDDLSQSESDGDDDGAADPPLTVTEALEAPFYTVAQPIEAYACIVCPGKLLKTLSHKESHAKSDAHKRRFKKFAIASENVDGDSPACLVAVSIAHKPLESESTSKRSKKKEARSKAMKDKREKTKKAKAKKASTQNVDSALTTSIKATPRTSSPAVTHKKKRKLPLEISQDDETEHASSLATPPPLSELTDRSILQPVKKKQKTNTSHAKSEGDGNRKASSKTHGKAKR